MRQTALFEVAGTGALTAWRATAGYWPTDGVEGRVRRRDRGDCRVERWELEMGVGAGTVRQRPARSGNRLIYICVYKHTHTRVCEINYELNLWGANVIINVISIYKYKM